MSLLLRRLRTFAPLHLTTPLAPSIQRLLSTTVVEAPEPNPHFAAVDYLTKSLGLPSDVAIRASKKLQHLKSPDKPEAMLQFLREFGIRESDIQTAVSRDPRILCSSVENMRLILAKLLEIGLSIEEISRLISRRPMAVMFNIVPKVDFWVRALGAAQFLSVVLRTDPMALFGSNLEKVIVPNLAFYREKFGFSFSQIAKLIIQAPRLISYNPETLKVVAKRAENLVTDCTKGTFVYALILVSNLSQPVIDSRINYLMTLGFSRENVNLMIAQVPFLLRLPEKQMGSKMQFLIEEARCDKLQIVQNPTLLMYSLEKRSIPRNVVRKLLKSKEIPAANNKFVSLMKPSEKDFLNKFVLPYEDAIPGLHQAYLDACAGKVVGTD